MGQKLAGFWLNMAISDENGHKWPFYAKIAISEVLAVFGLKPAGFAPVLAKNHEKC